MFLEKISKELEEKERVNLLNKKTKASDYLEEAFKSDDSDSSVKKNKEEKTIYPICMSFHKKTKLLSICLID